VTTACLEIGLVSARSVKRMCLLDGFTEVLLGRSLHLGQHHRAKFLGGEHLILAVDLNFNGGPAIRFRSNLKGPLYDLVTTYPLRYNILTSA
jgi:hypothetical protein